jgi:MOSC domain-containing protein YiiM
LYLFVGFFASPIGRLIEQHAEATDFAAPGGSTVTAKVTFRATAGSSGPSSSTRRSPTRTGARSSSDDLEFGRFGENFTVDGPADDEVRIGDRHRIGEAEFEVTQPRVTCYRVGMRLNEPRMAFLLVAHHRPGFYLRVIAEGRVRAADRITRTRTGRGSLTVVDTDALLYLPDPDPDPATLRAALGIKALSPGGSSPSRR